MYIPSVKSNISLISLFLISVLLFIWVENSRSFRKQNYYNEKILAAEWMKKAMQTIKDERLRQNIFIDEMNDPNRTAIIGEKNTLITTDRGSLMDKLTSTNPNMAAVIVDMFKEAKLNSGDEIVVNVTGSLPAMNIAVLSAAKALDLKVVLLSSVGASMFGFTDPDFTWLDAETLLFEKGIFPYKSISASIGGGSDLGRGLNVAGRDLILEAIERNNVQLVLENTLEKNIRKKMEISGQHTLEPKLYVNVGGGLSSLGNSIHGRLIPTGYHRFISVKNIPLKGTMFLYAEKKVPILHLLDIEKIAQKYELPIAPAPLPKIGEGIMFVKEHYNVVVAMIALGILTILIGIVIVFDHQVQKLRDDEMYKEKI
jgi:poly-gamma-glutamate system protein